MAGFAPPTRYHGLDGRGFCLCGNARVGGTRWYRRQSGKGRMADNHQHAGDRGGDYRHRPLCAEGRCTTDRSEEHTSELQSLMRISYAVFCLKKKIIAIIISYFVFLLDLQILID